MSKTDGGRSGLLGTQQCARQVKISGLLYDVVMASEREIKFTLEQAIKTRRRGTGITYSLTSTLDGVGGLRPRPRCFTPRMTR
jgi:hypothetical protein